MTSDNLAELTRSEIADAAPLIALALEWAEFPAQSHDDFAVCGNCGAYYLVDIAAGVEIRKFYLSQQHREILCERCVRHYGKVATE